MKDPDIFAALVAALIIFLLFVFVPLHNANAQTVAPTKYASIGNYGKSSWVQGSAMTNNGRYIYQWTQNCSKYCAMQRIDAKTKKHVKMKLGKNVAKYCGHANDMDWAWTGNQGYILVAPFATPKCKGGQRYLVILKVNGTTVSVYKRIKVTVCNKVSRVAVREVNGNTISIFVGGGGRNQTYATYFNLKTTKTISAGTLVYGLTVGQGLCRYKNAQGNEYVYTFSGGYDTKTCYIRKWQVVYGGSSGLYWKCIKTWTSYGEWEDGSVRNGVLYASIEGKSLKRKNISDRITRMAA